MNENIIAETNISVRGIINERNREYFEDIFDIKIKWMYEDTSQFEFRINGLFFGDITYSVFMDIQNKKFCYLEKIWVDDAKRNMGYGSTIFKFLCEEMKKKQCIYLAGELASDDKTEGRNFFRKQGCRIDSNQKITKSLQ